MLRGAGRHRGSLALRHGEQVLLTLLIPLALLVGLTLLHGARRCPSRGSTPSTAHPRAGDDVHRRSPGRPSRWASTAATGVLRRLAATAIPRWLLVAGRSGGVLAVVVDPGGRAGRRRRCCWAGAPERGGLGWAIAARRCSARRRSARWAAARRRGARRDRARRSPTSCGSCCCSAAASPAAEPAARPVWAAVGRAAAVRRAGRGPAGRARDRPVPRRRPDPGTAGLDRRAGPHRRASRPAALADPPHRPPTRPGSVENDVVARWTGPQSPQRRSRQVG